jgi:PAS domain S-box-containing protein
MPIEWPSDRARSVLIAVSILLALAMIVAFHWIIETGILFTHFFYVPILLSVIWWRRRGLAVTLFLIASLLVSDVLMGDARGLSEDLMRGAAMLAIALVTFTLNERAISKEWELEETNRRLEARVAERTASLDMSNQELRDELTLRIRTEGLLDMERRRLEKTLRSIGDGVLVTDRDGAVSLMNPGAEAMTGLAFKEALGRPIDEVVMLQDDSTGERLSLGMGAKALTAGPEQPIVLLKRSGGRARVAVSQARITMEGEAIGHVTVVTDITERERLNDEIWEQQHYRSIEILAGGIAHDFGNFLLSLSGNLELLKDSVQDRKGLERIDNVQKASHNAMGLTRQLMAFSKVGSPSPEGTDIRETLAEVARFNLAGSEIVLETDIDPGLSEVHMDRTHLSQVVGNIIINAKQAMGGKGTIRVRARNVSVMDRDRLRDGDYVRIEIEDDGPGMPEDVLRDVFEPYFTKRKEGAGLGMAITKYCVSKHGGMIEADSELKRGTVFTLHIPAACCQMPPGRRERAISL